MLSITASHYGTYAALEKEEENCHSSFPLHFFIIVDKHKKLYITLFVQANHFFD
jgi:hypothetical protein